MKHRIYFYQKGLKSGFLILFLLPLLCSCDLFSKDDDPKLEQLQLQISSNYLTTGKVDRISLEVSGRNDDGSFVPAPEYSLLLNGEDQGQVTSFNLSESGMYEVWAQNGSISSAKDTIYVREDTTYEHHEYHVIFHIVHDGEEIGQGYNLSQQAIDYQMSLLSNVFEDPDISLTENSVYPHLSFKLATIDPDGNTLNEPGIHRLERPTANSTVLFENWMWDTYWDPDYYINIWVGDTQTGYSWGIYPTIDCGADQLDGIFCTSENDPQELEGVALEKDNLWEGNWVLPHEIGHYLGLFHVFASVCTGDPDYLKDTRFYNRTSYENSAGSNRRTPCGGGIEYTSYNIMDYWNQPLGGRDLSFDQRSRIRHIVEFGKFRARLNPETGSPRDMSQFKPEEAKFKTSESLRKRMEF